MRLTPSLGTPSAQQQTYKAFAKPGTIKPLIYDGTAADLFKLCYTNLLLSIVTLGIYRFWGKTNIRKYIWSHVSFDGDQLEYTGTGKELFIGFLKALVYVAIFFGIQFAIPLLAEPTSLLAISLNLLSSAGLGLLYLAAQFSAQRYRLSRTSWRGIRGGMTGSAWAYAFRAGLKFLAAALIALLVPWWRMECLSMRTAASRFGNLPAYLDPKRSVCFWSFMLGVMILTAINIYLIFHVASIVGQSIDVEKLRYINSGLSILSLVIVAPIAFAPYYANVQHEFINNLSLNKLMIGRVQFYSSITVGRTLWQFLTAILILVCTLGLAWPLVLHRWLAFSAGNISISSDVDFAALEQASRDLPQSSEGLLEALDPGIF